MKKVTVIIFINENVFFLHSIRLLRQPHTLTHIQHIFHVILFFHFFFLKYNFFDYFW